MNPLAHAGAMAARPWRSSLLLLASVSCAPLAAQQLDLKPPPMPDPIKGWHDMSPMSPAEQAARAGRQRSSARPAAAATAAAAAPMPRAVLFDRPGDGRLWAAAPSYKASFGPEGFVYTPCFGSDAPQNHPVQFVLQSVHVGGDAMPLAAAEPRQNGACVTFDRGAVQERYELRVEEVEQTFVITSARPGDVDIVVRVVSELQEEAALTGIQFGNALGRVHYGQAHVVDGGRASAVATTWHGDTIRIHVPVELRGVSPLVVDPLIHTSAFSSSSAQNSSQPDIAYDATFDRYLAVWQYEFSATDTDVYCEFRNGDGTLVASSLGIVDITTLDHRNPRVANLNANDLFLMTMQRFEAGRWLIVGRRRLANSVPDSFLFAISDPVDGGHHVNADVGGDSGSGDQWFVVWERQLTAFDFDIHARRVRADTFQTSTIFIDNTPQTIHSLPSVSQSNGNGFTVAPQWLVAYQFRFSATDEDIYGATIAQNGTITTPNSAIDTSVSSDMVPSVSSPNTDAAGGNPLFLVTYERQNPFAARARLLSGGFVNQIPPVDLSASFGLGPFWVRAECDGNRFAVLSGAATIGIATLAYTGSALVLHETPQALPGIPEYPRLCSKRSGGGPRTDYGIAYVETSTQPDRINISAYNGRVPGNDVTRRVMGCNGLGIDVAGRPYLGESLTFTLSSVGFDIPGFVFGNTVPASTVFCTACPLGVDLVGAIVLIGSVLPIAVPTTAGLVGFQASVQGFGLGSGPCTLTLRFADTIDFTVR